MNFNGDQIDMNNIPKHIAFIMDGNGRWAKERNKVRTFGHSEGTKRIRDIALACNKLGVKAMTVFAFSTENFKRSEEEVNYIFSLPKQFFNMYVDELLENDVQIRYMGNLDLSPKSLKDLILSMVDKTKDNKGLILNFAFIYGARNEIVQACKDIASDVMSHQLSIDEINEDLFDTYLMSGDLPDVDLMIRTSGELRLSNFMLWQIAYAELIFTPVYWPDFMEDQLYECILEYQRRNRRFGGVKA